MFLDEQKLSQTVINKFFNSIRAHCITYVSVQDGNTDYCSAVSEYDIIF